jgi:hypothetical protein
MFWKRNEGDRKMAREEARQAFVEAVSREISAARESGLHDAARYQAAKQ